MVEYTPGDALRVSDPVADSDTAAVVGKGAVSPARGSAVVPTSAGDPTVKVADCNVVTAPPRNAVVARIVEDPAAETALGDVEFTVKVPVTETLDVPFDDSAASEASSRTQRLHEPAEGSPPSALRETAPVPAVV